MIREMMNKNTIFRKKMYAVMYMYIVYIKKVLYGRKIQNFFFLYVIELLLLSVDMERKKYKYIIK